VRFQVLTVTSVKTFCSDVASHVTQHSLAEIDRRFRGVYCLIIAMMMVTVSTSEISASFYRTKRRSVLEVDYLLP
jgi:hypothetical protein